MVFLFVFGSKLCLAAPTRARETCTVLLPFCDSLPSGTREVREVGSILKPVLGDAGEMGAEGTSPALVLTLPLPLPLLQHSWVPEQENQNSIDI